MNDAVVTATGLLDGIETVIAAMEYTFIGGSMGVVVGEKVTRAIERALASRAPMVIVSCSGGARMMEGALSLMQMAKTSAALARLDRAGLPFISVLTDPTTGGVTASFAMLGDLNIAEPKALIGFAGPRVIEQTIQQKLPEGFQRSEFLLDHGMIDMVVDRRELKATIARALRFMGAAPREACGHRDAGSPTRTGRSASPRAPERVGRPWTRSPISSASRSSASSSVSRTSAPSARRSGTRSARGRRPSSPARTARGPCRPWSRPGFEPPGSGPGSTHHPTSSASKSGSPSTARRSPPLTWRPLRPR